MEADVNGLAAGFKKAENRSKRWKKQAKVKILSTVDTPFPIVADACIVLLRMYSREEKGDCMFGKQDNVKYSVRSGILQVEYDGWVQPRKKQTKIE